MFNPRSTAGRGDFFSESFVDSFVGRWDVSFRSISRSVGVGNIADPAKMACMESGRLGFWGAIHLVFGDILRADRCSLRSVRSCFGLHMVSHFSADLAMDR